MKGPVEVMGGGQTLTVMYSLEDQESIFVYFETLEVFVSISSASRYDPYQKDRMHWWHHFSLTSQMLPGLDFNKSHWFAGVGVPTWFAYFATLVYPAFYFLVTRPRLRRRRLMTHLCAKCRYDLTGNESGTCPECGREIPAETREFLESHSNAESREVR
ncbi:MAG: hypothetical protein J5J06_07955 [Phycisphaerae bacterium]|nr:hypothetical protein [Phycisphaerae bacterium]